MGYERSVDLLVINTSQTFRLDVKFLYCPKCKELRVKAWYQLRPSCTRCVGDATIIVVKNSWLTYLTYALYVTVVGLVAVSLRTDDDSYLYWGIGLLGLSVVASFIDMSRAEKIARRRVKITGSDTASFRRKGWI